MMLRHVFKLVWNRKRANLPIVAEIFASFLVVFSLMAAAIWLWQCYRDPLGFDYRDVWHIDVARNSADEWGKWSPGEAETFRTLLRTLRAMPPVVAAAGASTAPYKSSVDIRSWDYDKRKVESEFSTVTPELAEVMGLELVAGRWLSPDDAIRDDVAVVIDEDLARQLVGDGDAVGRRISDDTDMRVVGVVRDYRRGGELESNVSYAFQSARLEADDGQPLDVVLVKLAPGTSPEFEATMVESLEAVAPSWSFHVVQLEAAREWSLRTKLVPLASAGLVAGFLLLMVVLGLTGVMWQNVTRRTREIGLRRAIGARRAHIQRQIVGEVMVTASLGLVIGAALAIQVPLVGPLTFVPFAVVVPALAVSAVTILALAAVCGVYPGWSATRIRPAEALHYE
jgi:putative ABC transport system permease protein